LNISDRNAVIKAEFNSKGSDLAAQIAKIKSEEGSGGIGLEVFRDAFLQLGGHQTEVDAINAELDKDRKPPQTPKISAAELNEKLGLTDADQSLADK